MKGMMLLMLVCASGCMTGRAERVHGNEEPKAELSQAPPESAYIATQTEESKGTIPGLGREGIWRSLTWSNGFEILVATSEDRSQAGVWYQVATYQNKTLLKIHEGIWDDPEAESYERIETCDKLAPVVYPLDGPVIGIGVRCHREGDNFYASEYVRLFRVDRPPTSLKDLTLLLRIEIGDTATGYYDNLVTETTLELRGKEIWRTDVATEGLSLEEEMEGVKRESTTTTTSERVTSF